VGNRLKEPFTFQIRTPRLLLRDLVADDIALIRRMVLEPAITRYQSLLKQNSEEEILQWVQDAIFYNNQQPRYAYNLAIVESHEIRAIGWIGWGRSEDPTHGEYSFGYALLPEYWGRGFMTEALRAGLIFMFETLGAQGITDYCESTNAGSKRVMEKAGMKLVARWTEETTPGVSVEYLRYAIQRAEWREKRTEGEQE
jgi:RimJ/RimL family protein N-acetyltransferase